jgi:hypothetical protein
MPTITIVFRGLLVLNKHQVNGAPSMEIGILAVHEPGPDTAPKHTPRIMTIRNGVREETKILPMTHPSRVWNLVVDDPVSTGITLRQSGQGPIDRMNATTPDDDFRWVINLENNEFPYGDIDTTFGLDRSELTHVVQITSGEFYTRLKSPLLRRSENGGPGVDFGALAGVMGLDIQVNSGGARLVGQAPNNGTIFTFSSDANVMYELANSPADTIETAPDHFHHYYHIFAQPPQQTYSFLRRPLGPLGAPAPNPALCGKIYLGEFAGSLDTTSGSSTSTPTSATSGGHSAYDHTRQESDDTQQKKVTAS